MPIPDDFEFRVSPDRRQFAIWEPGNEPWFAPEPAMQGRWITSDDMDRLGWTRYAAAPPPPPAVSVGALARALADLDHELSPATRPAWDQLDASEIAQYRTVAGRLLKRLRTLAPAPMADEAQQPTADPDGCTCAIAGEEFRPAGHYRDCPLAPATASQPGGGQA